MLDVNADLAGDVSSRFIDYNFKINRDMVKDMFRNTSLIDTFAGYPQKTFCIIE
jgi:hypothetical protein